MFRISSAWLLPLRNRNFTMSFSSLLPDDIMIDILLTLPVKSLLRFKCVSRAWRDFIDNRDFINMHLGRMMMDPKADKLFLPTLQYHPVDGSLESCKIFAANYDTPENFSATVEELYSVPFTCGLRGLQVVGACNGLVCMKYPTHGLRLLNPWTRRESLVPEHPQVQSRFEELGVNYGFGHDNVNDDYKVVRLVDLSDKLLFGFVCCEVQIYSLKSNSWRRTEKLLNNLCRDMTSCGVLVNGALHWILGRYRGYAPLDSITAIDLRSEKCRFVPLPEFPESRDVVNLGVVGLNGCLCVIANYYTGQDIWMMKDYGVRDSWTKLTVHQSVDDPWFPIAYSEHDKQVISYDDNQKVLVWCDKQVISYDDNEKVFVWYDSERKLSRKARIPCSGSLELIARVSFSVPSLVQPNGGAGSVEMRGTSTPKRAITQKNEESNKRRRM